MDCPMVRAQSLYCVDDVHMGKSPPLQAQRGEAATGHCSNEGSVSNG